MKPNPYINPSPPGASSVHELLRFFTVAERRRHMAGRSLGNFRLRKHGRRIFKIIDYPSSRLWCSI